MWRFWEGGYFGGGEGDKTSGGREGRMVVGRNEGGVCVLLRGQKKRSRARECDPCDKYGRGDSAR